MSLGFGIGKGGSGGAPGTSTLVPITGTGTATGNITADQAGFTLSFTNTNVFSVEDGSAYRYLSIDPLNFTSELKMSDGTGSSGVTLLSDLSGVTLVANLAVDDGVNPTSGCFVDGISFTAQLLARGGGNSVSALLDAATQTITLTALHHRPNLVEYASNAAALLGGLAAGDLYMTSGTVKIVT